MTILRPLVLTVGALAAADTSFAQPQREPIPRFVLDVRGASAGLPIAEGWTPAVPSGTQAPSRSLGVEAGAHLYLLRFRSAALGVGATWLRARGTTSPPEPVTTATPPPARTIPDVTTGLSSVAPQVSLNFGHSLGWSYVSAGLGQTRVDSEAVLPPRSARLESGGVKTFNFGGGARWFVNDHLGVGFDLRWHKLSLVSGTATRPAAPRASLVTAAVGIAIK